MLYFSCPSAAVVAASTMPPGFAAVVLSTAPLVWPRVSVPAGLAADPADHQDAVAVATVAAGCSAVVALVAEKAAIAARVDWGSAGVGYRSAAPGVERMGAAAGLAAA